jgi:hypothetical protein
MNGIVIRGDVQCTINCMRVSKLLFKGGGGGSDEQVVLLLRRTSECRESIQQRPGGGKSIRLLTEPTASGFGPKLTCRTIKRISNVRGEADIKN